MNVAERSLLSADKIMQPSPGIHFAFTKIPWSSRDQWPRLSATSGQTMYHFLSQTAILGPWESDKSIHASVRVTTNVAYVRSERLMLAIPMAMAPVD